MELRIYLSLIRRRLALILVTMVIGGVVAYTISNTEPRYAAQSTIYVGSQTFDEGTIDASSTVAVERVSQTFARMIDSEPIAQAALDRAGLDGEAKKIVDKLSAQVELGTTLISVRFTDPSPERARDVANAVAESFVERAEELEPPTGETGEVPRLPATLFEEARLPEAPVPTTQLRNTMLGAIFGLLLAVGLVLLLDYVDVTAKTASDIETQLELPVLGIVPSSRELARGRQAVTVSG